MRAIDHYAWDNRWRHRHPGEKLLLAGGLLLIANVLPPLTTAPLIILVAGLATVVGAGIPLATLLRVVAVPATFLLTSVPLLAVSVDFEQGLALSPAGLDTALQVGARALAAVFCLTLLLLTTPVLDWAPLLRRTGVPAVIIELLLLIYRLVFVFAERATTATQAQIARQGYSTFPNSVRSLGLLAASLLQRSLAQARRLEIGLAARAYDGELRVLTPTYPLSCRRLVLTGAVLLGVALAGGLLPRLLGA
jgi:cobalt/nickel transport system permease protein